MSELPTKHFELHEGLTAFRDWLQAHGGRVVHSAPVSMESPGRQTWYYEAIPGAVVLLEIDNKPDVLAVTAKLTTGRAGAAYTWNGDAAKLVAFNELCGAILTNDRARQGARAGTLERVRQMHRLIKNGMSQREAAKQARTDPRTYIDWCEKATGESPYPDALE